VYILTINFYNALVQTNLDLAIVCNQMLMRNGDGDYVHSNTCVEF